MSRSIELASSACVADQTIFVRGEARSRRCIMYKTLTSLVARKRENDICLVIINRTIYDVGILTDSLD